MSNLDLFSGIASMISSSIKDSKFRLGDVDNESDNLKIYNTLLAMNKYHCFENCEYNCEFSPIFKEDSNFVRLVYNNGYLISGLDEESFADYGLNLSHEQLKQLAGQFNLKTYGRKADIIKRISDNVDLKEVNIGYWNLSKRGKKFIKQHEYISYYNDFFYDFNFTDFEKHCSDSKLDSYFAYLDSHEKLAIEKGDLVRRCKTLLTYSNICSSEGIDAFEKSIEEFCLRPLMDVNRIRLSDLFYIFESDNFENIKKFSQNHSIDEMDEIFDKYYCDDCRISKNEMLNILHEILECDELYRLSYDLLKKYGQRS